MSNYIYKLTYFFVAVMLGIGITGCAPKLNFYQTSVNAPREELTEHALNGKSKVDVLTELGIPELQAVLTKNREVWRYYAEELELEVREYGHSYTKRIRYQVELWFEHGKVIKVQQNKKDFINPYGRSGSGIADRTKRDYYVYDAYVDMHLNVGFPYNTDAASSIKAGTPLNEVLWELGLPNRIINSAKGEIFVYEHSYFDNLHNQKSGRNFHYSKNYFVISDSEVVEGKHFSQTIDLSNEAESDYETSGYLNVAMNAPGYAAKGMFGGFWEKCLELSNSTTTCKESALLADAPDKDVAKILYRAADMDIGYITQERNQLFQKISGSIESDALDPSVELLLVYRASIPSTMLVGETNLKELFSTDRLMPYYENLMGSKGQFAKTWLNFGQVDKWYFDKQGRLGAAVHFSPISPASPWYAFGPMAMDIDLDPVKGAACTMFSGNCLNSLEKIYRRSLVIPEL